MAVAETTAAQSAPCPKRSTEALVLVRLGRAEAHWERAACASPFLRLGPEHPASLEQPPRGSCPGRLAVEVVRAWLSTGPRGQHHSVGVSDAQPKGKPDGRAKEKERSERERKKRKRKRNKKGIGEQRRYATTASLVKCQKGGCGQRSHEGGKRKEVERCLPAS